MLSENRLSEFSTRKPALCVCVCVYVCVRVHVCVCMYVCVSAEVSFVGPMRFHILNNVRTRLCR